MVLEPWEEMGEIPRKTQPQAGFWPQRCVKDEEFPLAGVVPNVDPLTESLPLAATLEWKASAPSGWRGDEWAPVLSWAN